MACELATTSITSPGNGDYTPGVDTGAAYAPVNREVIFSDQTAKGFLLLTLGRGEARGEMIAASTITSKDFTAKVVKSFQMRPDGAGVSWLTAL